MGSGCARRLPVPGAGTDVGDGDPDRGDAARGERRLGQLPLREHEDEPIYTFRISGAPILTPVQTLKAISRFEYQACEPPEWEFSEAHAFCRALESEAIRNLPGYDDADGLIDDSWTGPRY